MSTELAQAVTGKNNIKQPHDSWIQGFLFMEFVPQIFIIFSHLKSSPMLHTVVRTILSRV